MLKQDEGLKGIQASIGKALAVIPLSPNQWTFLSVALALLAALAVAYTGSLILGLALFALAAVFDAVDGAVARARGEVSAFGGFIDGVADRFVEALFLFSFMFVPLPTVIVDAKIWLAILIFLGTCMPSFIRAYADHKGAVSREKALALGGIFERSERLLLVVIGLAAGMLATMDYFVYAIILGCALSFLTVLQRLLAVMGGAKG
ncbi:MAG TPA: CDP-alcohol phosphatidyltransferase family protein [Candidatus Bilamarchaeum sp.]|nr:CDP-alcohol phosphatidyltransferase family protein [Candidatus Bilamarchaeum sp.]